MNHLTASEKIRYEMRNEIEQIIKEQNIDRMKFHETKKDRYEQIICKLYYTFFDYEKYPKIQLPYMWTRFRDTLAFTQPIWTDWNNWEEYINCIDSLIPEKISTLPYYLLVDGGWLYDGILSEIKKVLQVYPDSMEDFYLFPRDYKWLINHCDDGACMYRVWKP